MGTFSLPRFTRTELRRTQTKALDDLLCEIDAKLERHRKQKLPGEYAALRGIPACGGPIPGESDLAALMQQQPGRTH